MCQCYSVNLVILGSSHVLAKKKLTFSKKCARPGWRAVSHVVPEISASEVTVAAAGDNFTGTHANREIRHLKTQPTPTDGRHTWSAGSEASSEPKCGLADVRNATPVGGACVRRCSSLGGAHLTYSHTRSLTTTPAYLGCAAATPNNKRHTGMAAHSLLLLWIRRCCFVREI